MIRDFLLLVSQLFVLWGFNQLGYFIVNITNIPLPGNVIAMFIVVVLLMTGVLPVAVVEKAGNLLLKHLAFFFIPIAVGLIKFTDLFLQNGVALLLGILLSALSGMYVTGCVSQYLARKKEVKACE